MGSMEARDTAPETAQMEKRIPAPGRKGSRKRSITIFALISLLNVGLLVFLWTQLLTPAQVQNQANSNDPLVGHPAPNFMLDSLILLPSAPIALPNFKGNPVVLIACNSLCLPYRTAH